MNKYGMNGGMGVANPYKGMKLDVGCGVSLKEGYIGLDKRKLDGVSIVHDLEVFPYPIEDNTFAEIRGHHVIEHIKPWLTVDFMNELWRIMEPGGLLTLDMPYGGTNSYRQDPTHCSEFIELTFWYFDPRNEMYQIYQPKTWFIKYGYPLRMDGEFLRVLMWKLDGNLDALIAKNEEGKTI